MIGRWSEYLPRVSEIILAVCLLLGAGLPQPAWIPAAAAADESPAAALADAKKKKKKKVFTLGIPSAKTSSEDLQAAEEFIAALLVKLDEVSAEYAAAVSGKVPAWYAQDSADTINQRNGVVQKKAAAALTKLRANIGKLLKHKKLKKSKAVIPASPFGPALRTLPAEDQKDALQAARIQIGQMESYDYSLMQAIQELVTPPVSPAGLSAALKNDVANNLVTALEKDIEGLGALSESIASRRYSTAGISDWTEQDLTTNANGTIYTGGGRDIQEGLEFNFEVDAALNGSTVNLVFKELWEGFTTIECTATGQVSENGAVFQGQMAGSVECGTVDGTIDPKGRISGVMSGYSYGCGDQDGAHHCWGIEQLQLEGLIGKDGIAQLTTRSVLVPGVEPGQLHTETVLTR